MESSGDGPSKLPTEDKGKGKMRMASGAEGSIASSGSLVTNIMQSARSSVTPANLSTIMTANGKGTGLRTSIRIPEQSFDDVRQPYAADSSSEGQSFRSNGFHQTTKAQDTSQGDAYRQFAEMGPSRIDLGIDEALRSSSPVFVGPYSSAQALDAALHDQVRASSSHQDGLEEAWQAQSLNAEAPQYAGYDEAWAQAVPNMPVDRLNDLQRGASIDRLLQTVSLSDQPRTFAHDAPPTDPQMDFVNLLNEEERHDEDASTTLLMSDEQVQLHRALHELQESEGRANEKIRPPDDDALARAGVYAATPEEALQAIWDSSAEGERGSSIVRNRKVSGQDVSKKVRELLKRGSYVDDVYGIPPQLEKTIVAAEEPETEENSDRRAKAISRLDALYRHLGASTSSEASIDDFVRNW